VKEESFLEYINQLVMTGEVAGLFPREEMDALLNDVRGVFKRESPGNAPMFVFLPRKGLRTSWTRLQCQGTHHWLAPRSDALELVKGFLHLLLCDNAL